MQLVDLLMQVLIVLLSISQLLLKLQLSGPQGVLLVPGFIPVTKHMNQHALAVPVSCGHPVLLFSHCQQILTQHIVLLDCLVPLQSHMGQQCLQPQNLTLKLKLQLALLILNCQQRPTQESQTALQTSISLHHGKHSTHSCTNIMLILIRTPLQSTPLGLIPHQSVEVTPGKHPSEGVGQLLRKPLHDVPENCKSNPAGTLERCTASGLVHLATPGGVTATGRNHCLDPHQGPVTKLLSAPIVARFPSFRIPHRTEHQRKQGRHPKLSQELALMTLPPRCQLMARGPPTSGLASGESCMCHLLKIEYLG